MVNLLETFLNISTRRVGGIRFLKVGRLTFAFSVSRASPPQRSLREIAMLTNADGTKILIPTGRGSYVFFGEKTLEKLLASFDRAHPEYTDMTKEEVIAAYREAEQQSSK